MANAIKKAIYLCRRHGGGTEIIMKFCWSTLNVKNMEETLHFYKDIVGLRENRRFPAGPKMEIVFLGDGDTQIELICDKSKKEFDYGSDISWGFQVDSLERLMTTLRENGVDIAQGPVQPNPHTRFIHVNDPNGMRIQFVEMM